MLLIIICNYLLGEENERKKMMEEVGTLIDEEIGKVLGGGDICGRVRNGRLAPLEEDLLRVELDTPERIILGFDAGDERQSVVILRRGADVVEPVQSGRRKVLRRQTFDVEIRSR